MCVRKRLGQTHIPPGHARWHSSPTPARILPRPPSPRVPCWGLLSLRPCPETTLSRPLSRPASGPWNPGLSRPPVGPTPVPHSPFSVRLCGSAVCGLPPPSLMVSLERKPPKFQEKSGWTVLPSTVGGFRGRVPTRGREGNLQWHLREAPLLLIQSGLECGELLLRSRVCCTLCSAAPCRTFCHSFLLRISLGLRCTWSGSL